MGSAQKALWTCSSCIRAQSRHAAITNRRTPPTSSTRAFQTATRLYNDQASTTQKQDDSNPKSEENEQGALSRRLSEMAEETMNTGSRSDRKTMAEAGFSEELKRQLEERIAQSSFAAENQKAISQANLPPSAGRGTREQAAAEAWTGTESLHDSALRMLDDSHKKLRMPARAARPPVNLRPAPKVKNISVADRLANARDKTSIYAFSQQNDMTEEEREKMRKELKERFTPGARPMPTTLQGLTSLANERIEDAIARGQFRNIQRGKGVNIQRDYTANSPFLDTTEYFMNKIIQKQDIVPPWIEKQQELMKLVGTFRSRLRNDWRRHAARSIASEGGGIESQVRRARSYALAEEIVNPRPGRTEKMTGIDSSGALTTITVEERIAAGVEVEQEEKPPEVTITVTETAAGDTAPSQPTSVQPSPTSSVLPMPYPFRDREWERIESAYHNLAVQELNDTTRSYNLMAPKVAQKPYYTLQRELNKCFSEVAPLIADEILERSRKPNVRVEIVGHREGGIMEKFQGDGHVAKVRDEDERKGYGFKEFWKDLFRKNEAPRRRNTV